LTEESSQSPPGAQVRELPGVAITFVPKFEFCAQVFLKGERTASELGLLCILRAHYARLCRFLRVQLWTTESTKHANEAGTSKSSPSFWRSCRTKLTNEVYRFSPI
jgi:hypothetical protein